MTSVFRKACGGCGSADLADFLDLGSTPLADRFPRPAERDGESYPLQVAVCQKCWLAQLRCVVDGAELFGADYAFLTGASPALAAYYAQWATWAMAEYGAQARRGVIEIACNDGTLLSRFALQGCPVLGIEPAGPPADAAEAAGLGVVREPFTSELPLRAGIARAGLVIANNVMAHVEDPFDVLDGIRRILAPGGVAVCEFQYLGDLLAGAMIDHVYHEHRFFYSLASFTALAREAGLYVTRAMRTPNQGGSLRVVLSADEALAGFAPPLPLEDPMTRIGIYAGMQSRAMHARGALLEALDAELAQGRTIAGYGASAKSATLLGFCGIGPGRVSWIEDLTPGKIGRVTPGTRIPVIAPSEMRADTYLLTAWNYLSSVVRREAEFLASGGKLIVPGPVPVTI